MEIIFTGTGSAKTSLERYHSSFIIKAKNFNLLIDAGDGISRALLEQNISPESIDGILFSHLHPDHFSGLTSLIIQMKLLKRKKKLIVLSNDKITPVIKTTLFNSYIFPERENFEIIYNNFQENSVVKISDELNFISKENKHLDDYYKYAKMYNVPLSSSGFIFTIGNNKIFYTGDIGNEDDLHLFDDFDYDILISEVTHIKPENLFEFIKSRGNIKKVFLTHLSDGDKEKLKNIIINSTLIDKGKIILPDDGFSFLLP